MTDNVKITAGGLVFEGRLESGKAPQTVAAFRERLPYVSQLVHVRWSGEGGSKSLREITARPQASGGSLWPFALFLAALAAFAVWWKWARRSRKN